MKGIRILFRIIPLVAWLAIGVNYGQAQALFHGRVTDADTGNPVEMATVQLLRGNAKRLVAYALTDATGSFTLKAGKDTGTDSLQVAVSLLGYKTLARNVHPGEPLSLALETESYQLKEVQIRPGRVYGNRDTVNYDVAQFLSGRDESIKDIIKKLPGLDVDDLGKIRYNGKDISHFYVEGMDLMDGRYNRINNNLQARAVEKVQILENHQPIRLLQDRVKVEDVAINLKLKSEFRDIWMGSIKAGIGAAADELLWEGGIDAMQLNRKSQTAYLYKGNNRGQDVTDEQLQLIENASNQMREPSTPSFLSQPSLMAPLKKERLLFNDVHTLSANRLYKLNETTQLRLNAGYIHDVRRQERGSTTTYYQAEDTVRITEAGDTRIRSDQADLRADMEQNATTHFLTNKFAALGNWERSRSLFSGHQEVDQRINTSQAGIRNEFRNLWNKDEYNTFEVHSFLRYNQLPAELVVDGVGEEMNVNQFYTDNSFSFLRKKGILSQRYNAGMTVQTSTIRDGWSTYVTPSWQAIVDKWRASLTLPVVWTAYPGADFSRLSLNPSLFLEYKLNYAWRFTLSGSYREQLGSETDFYAQAYRRDYRNRIWNDGILSVQQQQHNRLYGEYKNTIREFFATLSLSHYRIRLNRMYEQLFDDGQVTLAARNRINHSSGWNVNGAISKGFYDWKMKASLNWLLSHQQGEQLSEGTPMSYRADYMQYEPKISWVPTPRMDISYQSTIRYGGSRLGESTQLTPLWNVVQQLSASYTLSSVEINLSADHYYNDVTKDKSVNTFLADLSLKWKVGSWQIEASATNLFDKRQYGYTQYASLESYTSWINIRGREFFLSARYRFR